jgi:magnesium-protoporphyrin IX monomethyl ester (oxidative) cyclase
MKVLLINPPWLTPKKYEEKLVVPYPLGICYIASYLEENGVKVRILDVLAEDFENKSLLSNGFVRFGLSDEKILENVKQFQPEIIGITCLFTSQSEGMHNLAKLLKTNFQEILIVVGGIHASSCPQDVMSDRNIDFVVRGEGEITMLELVKALENKNDVKKVKGIYYRENGEIKYTGDRSLNMNLDSFPFPAYHLLNMKKYFEAGRKGKGSREGASNKKYISLITSRGCPYECFFCSIKNIYGKVWRARSPEKVLEEIEMLVKKYGIVHFLFEDDNLTLDIERAKKIFKGIIERNIKITWETPNGIRADRIDEELIKLMKESGCVSLTIGIECGDQDFLTKIVKKNLNLQDVIKAVKIITKYNIPLNAFFILGMPGENKKTINKTISFARNLTRMGVYPEFNIATPLPATEMYEIAKKKGLLIKEDIAPFDIMLICGNPLIKVEGYTPKQLVNLRRKAILLCLLDMLIFNPKTFLSRKETRKLINPFYIIKKLFTLICRK